MLINYFFVTKQGVFFQYFVTKQGVFLNSDGKSLLFYGIVRFNKEVHIQKLISYINLAKFFKITLIFTFFLCNFSIQ